MEGIHEVDPSGDVILILRNPGAPFADAATEAELADEESPAVATEAPAVDGDPAEDASAIAADTARFELQPTSNHCKKKKDKKKKRTRPSSIPIPGVFRLRFSEAEPVV
jgi:hypothetical protein